VVLSTLVVHVVEGWSLAAPVVNIVHFYTNQLPSSTVASVVDTDGCRRALQLAAVVAAVVVHKTAPEGAAQSATRAGANLRVLLVNGGFCEGAPCT
jgi:hypothetical protein